MVDIRIKCPKCAHELDVKGNPGDEIYITCPKCNTYGSIYFQQIKKKIQKLIVLVL